MISEKILYQTKNGSMIRAMFEEGARLKKIYGEDKVYDFSLGNPDYEPPEAVIKALKKYILDEKPGIHAYMNNAGYQDVRQKIADSVAKESGLPIASDNIVMTCGAAGGLNVVLKTILDPDDEVILFAPYFVEYNFYIDNHGGKSVIVPPDYETFEPNLSGLEKAINKKTKAIILDNPNNPTGVVYSREKLEQVSAILEKKEKEYNTTIYVISDEPYNKLAYDGVEVPNLLNIFKNAILVNSFSKSLALPGERIGFICASPQIEDLSDFMTGLAFCNRTLGFVNAPSLFQRVAADAINEPVNTDELKRRRDFLYENLTKLGYSCVKPKGAFYMFPKSLIEDDVEFCKRAAKYNLLIVPGSGFRCPGYFRLAYCVSFETIKNSIPAFKALAEEFK